MLSAFDFPVKRSFPYALVLSVGIFALLGVFAILSGKFGWFEVRILLTTITIAGGSVCGLACGASLAAGRGRLLPWGGLASTLLAVVLISAGIWLRIDLDGELYWKLTASSAVFAVACAHLALLSLARLSEWFHWAQALAQVVILAVAGLIVVMIVFEPHGTGMFQLLAVASIIDAAITILIPIFHRLSRGNFPGDSPAQRRQQIEQEIARLKQRLDELERLRQDLS